MDLGTVMHAQTRDTLRIRQAERDPCPGKLAYASKDDADRHRLRGMVSGLCQRCYRFHYGPPAPPTALALFARG